MSAQPASAEWPEIRDWRKRMRAQLLAEREAMDPAARRELAQRAKERLLAAVDLRRYHTLGLYWPIRGEIDLRDVARAHVEAGGEIGLPVVVERAAPVEFWRWRPGAPMSRGLWNIPVPAERELVNPDALVVPLVGYDRAHYRLGYGGGYYDRTIAAATPRPVCIGFGYSYSALESIGAQPHDLPMDLIVTDAGVFRP